MKKEKSGEIKVHLLWTTIDENIPTIINKWRKPANGAQKSIPLTEKRGGGKLYIE